MANPCIFVLGVPRSGTSCVAGIVHRLGVSMGDNLMPADEWNPAGYYQDQDFENILHEAFGEWVFPDWTTSKPSLTGPYAKQIKALAATRAGKGIPWGVKSNRLVFFWNALVAGAGEVKVILTRRPMAESLASWEARSGYADGDSQNPIRRMANAVVKGAQQMGVTPALTVDFNRLFSDTEAVVSEIAAVCGVPVTQEAIDFVNVDLRRFQIDG